MLNSDGFGYDVGAEVVEAYGEVFGAWAGAVVGRNFDATLVVFKNSTVDSRGGEIQSEAASLEFGHELHYADDVAEGGGESDVFGFGGG